MKKSAFSGNLAKYLEKNAKLLPDSYAVLFQHSPNIKKTFAQLNDDVINIINDFIKIKCHVCKKCYKIEGNFYKKQNKFYYCSKECYLFI